GWSREQAVQFMFDNSPLSAGVGRPEIDRYAVSPGQATSYMIGRLEIQRLRREAQERQGDGFEVKRFHSAVLDSGSLPLDVLEQVAAHRLPLPEPLLGPVNGGKVDTHCGKGPTARRTR